MTDQKRRAWSAVASATLFVIALAARIFLYAWDLAYGNQLSILTFLVAAAAALAAVTIAIWIRGRHPGSGTASASTRPGDIIAAITAAAAVAVLFFGGLQAVLPNTPQAAAAAACRGVPTAGAPAYGQTVETGANARAGAGSGYPTKDRFGPSCTVGFDGFCVGEPIANTGTALPDQRWLIVHGRTEVVSAALIRLQSPQADLGSTPSRKCAKTFHGVTGPVTLSWTAIASGKSAVLTANSPGSVLFGFAVGYTPTQANGSYPYANVGKYSPTPGFVSKYLNVTWNPQMSPAPLPGGSGSLVVVAEACYADDAPVTGTARVKTLTFRAGMLVKAANLDPTSVPDGLRRQACSVD